MDAEALAKVKAAYDAVAPAYAGQFLHELDGKPFDRALLVGFAELVRGQGTVADLVRRRHPRRRPLHRGVARRVCQALLRQGA